jgi:hypothetical protein
MSKSKCQMMDALRAVIDWVLDTGFLNDPILHLTFLIFNLTFVAALSQIKQLNSKTFAPSHNP